MQTSRTLLVPLCVCAGIVTALAQPSECSFFGSQREAYVRAQAHPYALSDATEHVSRRIPSPEGRVSTARLANFSPLDMPNLIDRHIFAGLRNAGVKPAPSTTDYEFIRRVTLDLTGRVPTPEKLAVFIADTRSDKRARLVEELLASPEWIDKWTMFFGDLFKITIQNSQVTMFNNGRDAFRDWLKAALTKDQPYDSIVSDMITVGGDNSYRSIFGPINWWVGGRVNNGPVQDIWDQQTANIAETFLGISHVNCLLCHNGRGHLDSLSLWATRTSRTQAWQMASFVSHTEQYTQTDPSNSNAYFWLIADNRNYKTDYPLNTTTGNRPPRQPIGAVKNIAPAYLFDGQTVNTGTPYRDALAYKVTHDPQFARAAVNYVWEHFFGRGIVHPSNQFDPARLDPDNPPEDGWTLQPSNPWLLNELAQNFAASKFNLKALMRLIVTSETYQLSSRYPGTWNPEWEPLFARKMVRRLWGEEVMDAVAQTSNIMNSYTVNSIKYTWIMQTPEPNSSGAPFLAPWLGGNRDDDPRRPDATATQALYMMNDSFLLSRTRNVTGSLANKAAALADDQAVTLLFQTVLSRNPSAAEKSAAMAALASGTRSQKIEDLLWALYNKVDFLYNY